MENLIKADDRSARYVATRAGINPSSFSERLKGKSPFLADELESIARVLKLDPVEFYSKYIAVGTGPLEPQTSTVEAPQFAPDHMGELIPLRAAS